MEGTHRITNEEYRHKHRKGIAKKAAIADAFEARGQLSVARKIRECCEFEDLVCCSACGHRWWVVSHCDLRVCPICAQRNAIRRSRGLMALAEGAKAPKMLTLTMPRWKGNPREGIQKLRKGILELRKTNLLRNARAGAYTIELVHKPDGWHIHAHAIVDVEFIPFQKLMAAWSHCIRVKGAHVRVQGASAKAVQRYICKYATKSGADEMALEEIVDWWEAVKGSRLWATWGAWYGNEAREIIDKAEQSRPQAQCPYCGEVHTIFKPMMGKAIFGDNWAQIRDQYGGDEEWRRRIASVAG